MPEFMLLIHEVGDLAPAKLKVRVESFRAFERELGEALLDGERLRPSAEGTRVWADRIEAGPFETMDAYYFIRADSLDAAVALAKKFPGPVDVRPVMKGLIVPNKANLQGRVFALGVLGRAQTEEAWIDVMDRIDERTSAGTLGGVRLREPGSGRRITTIVSDGPFLESKDVIGGIVFVRFGSIEEAIEHAQCSEFVTFGALEIRELWRS